LQFKRIEIINFKSFAERTEIELSDGITAIVGPNGSGKSNIADAVRWVLGEQSAKYLRGAKMEDVIFNGTDHRKKANFCEVSITFNNELKKFHLDFTEITVKRRLYRTGESEFFINNQSVRLKDIIELFMDTGIGKEAYSIIGQGKIDQILSTKAEERRGIFEEAAGIVKYKARKKEAEKKIEETEQNLLRISDIMADLNGQIPLLEQQASKAREFKKIKKEIQDNEIKYYVAQIDLTYKKWHQAIREKEEYLALESDKETELHIYSDELEKNKINLITLENKLDENQGSLLQITEKIEKLEGRKQVLLEKVKNKDANKLLLEESFKTLKEKEYTLEEEERKLTLKIEDVKWQTNELENLLKSRTKIFASQTEQQIDEYKAKYFDILHESSLVKNNIRFNQQQLDNLQQKKHKITTAYSELKIKKENLEIESNKMNEDKRKLQSDLEEIMKIKEELHNNLMNIENDITSKNVLVLEKQKTLQKLLAKENILIDMQEDYSGFSFAVKNIIKYKDNFPNIHGVIADLISVDLNYIEAIETALGNSLQYVVVDNEKSAREVIEFLKKNSYGRSTFLPLDIIKGRYVPQDDLNKVLGFNGFIGIANSLITTKEEYRVIIDFLLGNIFVVDNLLNANILAKILRHRYRIVTLEGDVVNVGGAITGGKDKKNNNILTREKEIKILKDNILHIKTDLEQYSAQINKQVKLKQELNQQINSLNERWMEINNNLQNNINKHKLYKMEIEKIMEQLTFLEHDEQINNNEYQNLEQELISLETKLLELSTIEDEIRVSIDNFELERKNIEQKRENAQQELTKLQIDIAKNNKEYELLVEQKERLKSEKKKIIEELTRITEMLSELEQFNEENQQDKENIESELLKSNFNRNEISQNLAALKNERVNLLSKITEIEEKVKNIRRELNNLSEKVRMSESKVSRYDTELENYLNSLAEEYEMSYDWAKEHYPVQNVKIEELGIIIKEKKSMLQKLGDVNLGAIEEYQRISERYNFLEKQYNDLESAKRSLQQVILDVDKEMERKFAESMEIIKKEFLQIYRKLFDGGYADLILTANDSFLESGIEIVAQPPGKKLQNLSLLSGGEKALTAIALVFALLKLKPAPFVILDEVEAALDDVNIMRFVELLKEFNSETQFLIITHRKGTMEGADTLFGVTMREPGVSQLLSINIEKIQKQIESFVS